MKNGALVVAGCMDIQYASPSLSDPPIVLSVADSPSASSAAATDAPAAASAAATTDWLAKLNDAQREAAEYGTDDIAHPSGALLVIAGAGSGKTSTLAHRVANLVVKGADPRRILLLTFSRRAAHV